MRSEKVVFRPPRIVRNVRPGKSGGKGARLPWENRSRRAETSSSQQIATSNLSRLNFALIFHHGE
jgi:hypothetical protein